MSMQFDGSARKLRWTTYRENRITSPRAGRRRYRSRMLGYVLPVITLALGIFIGARLGEVPTLDDARRAADAAGAMAIDWTSRSIQRMRNAVTASQADADGGIAGQARVIDGDTLDIRGTRIRLHGIDAPESRQMCRAAGRYWSCGQQASRALAELIGPRRVVCSERGRDRYGRIVAVCLAGRTDLNRWMVAKGWAFAYRQYARLYVADEMAARAAGRGIWRGDAVPPWDWRRGERLPGVSSGSSESRKWRPAGTAPENSRPAKIAKSGNTNETLSIQ